MESDKRDACPHPGGAGSDRNRTSGTLVPTRKDLFKSESAGRDAGPGSAPNAACISDGQILPFGFAQGRLLRSG